MKGICDETNYQTKQTNNNARKKKKRALKNEETC